MAGAFHFLDERSLRAVTGRVHFLPFSSIKFQKAARESTILDSCMVSDAKQSPSLPSSPAAIELPVHEGAVRPFWRLLTFFDSRKLSPYLALRNAAGVLLPLVIGHLLGMPRGGLAVASGALNVSYSDSSEPYAERAKRMLASSFLCAFAVSLGAMAGRYQVLSIMIATAWAFITGLFVAVGSTAADLGVISLVLMLIYAAQPLTPHEAAYSGILALSGGLLQTALSLALWPVRRYEPERRALSAFFFELASVATTPTRPGGAPPASSQGMAAQQILSSLGRDTTLEGVRYRALLTQAERMRLCLIMVGRLRVRIARENPDHPAIPTIDRYLQSAAELLRALGESIQSASIARPAADSLVVLDSTVRAMRGWIASAQPSFFTAVAEEARFQMAALSGQIRAALDLAAHNTPAGAVLFAKQEARQPWWLRFSGRLATLRANLNLQSSAFRHALRLMTLVAFGDALARSLSWHRTYWLPMTIALVLKPEFTTTFTRGLLRIAGTITGLLLATALFHFFPTSAWLQITLIFIFVFLLRWVGPANYGIFCVAISAVVVLMLAVAGIAPKDVIIARGINTVAGGALAFLAYGLWPTWERTRVSERIAQMLDAYRDYFHALSEAYQRNESANSRELDSVRIAARVMRSNFETSLDRLAAEPGTTPDQMNLLNGILVSSHRFVHAVMALDAGWLQTPSVPSRPAFPSFAADVETALFLLSAELRGTRDLAKKFPKLRDSHSRLVASGDPETERYALVNIEGDRITNSLNTLREQTDLWTHKNSLPAPISN